MRSQCLEMRCTGEHFWRVQNGSCTFSPSRNTASAQPLCQRLGAASTFVWSRPPCTCSELCPSLSSRVLSSQLVMLCKLHPALILEVSKEILEFTGTVSNIQNMEPIFTHMVSRACLLLPHIAPTAVQPVAHLPFPPLLCPCIS